MNAVGVVGLGENQTTPKTLVKKAFGVVLGLTDKIAQE